MKYSINVMPSVGKWSPNPKNGNGHHDVWDDHERHQRSESVTCESQSPSTPVWTPRSAQCSPVASRKQYRPVQFQSPTMERKFTNLGETETPPPPWEQPGFDKLPPHVHHHHQPHDRVSSSSVRRLAQSYSAPKLNSLTDDGHSESCSKHSGNYLCPPTRSLFEGKRVPIDLIIEIYYASVL